MMVKRTLAEIRAIKYAKEDEALRLRREGLTLREIGERMGLSGERVRQKLILAEKRQRATSPEG